VQNRVFIITKNRAISLYHKFNNNIQHNNSGCVFHNWLLDSTREGNRQSGKCTYFICVV